jgi:hypothetical protein
MNPDGNGGRDAAVPDSWEAVGGSAVLMRSAGLQTGIRAGPQARRYRTVYGKAADGKSAIQPMLPTSSRRYGRL